MKPRDIALQLTAQRKQKQDTQPWYRAEIVEMRNSIGKDTIEVENRPYFVWVRLWSAQGNVVPAYNVRVAAVAGLPVLVSRMPGSESGLEIIGLDIEIFEAQDIAPNAGLTQMQHAAAHEWPDASPGLDVVTVYPRSWSQLRVYATDPLSLVVNVSPLRYVYNNALVRFDGGTVDLTAAVGALAVGTARLVLIYLDLATNTLGSTNGAVGADAGGWALDEPALTNKTYPSAVVRIYNGQTEIDEDAIRDRRMFINGSPGSSEGWPFDRILTVDTTDADADYTTVAAAIAGVAADELILVSPETHACNNQTLPADTGLGSWDRQLALLSTAAQLIALTTSSDTHIFHILFENTTNNAANTEALRIGASGCELWSVRTDASNGAAGGDGIGFYVVNTVTGVRLTDCYARGSSVGGLGYGLYIPDGGSADVVIRDGTYNGNDADLFVGSGSTVHLYGPRLVNGTIGGTGAVDGWYFDENNTAVIMIADVGIGAAPFTPNTELEIRGATDPTIRLNETGDLSSFFDLIQASAVQSQVQHTASAGNAALIDFDPISADNLQACAFRFFRVTNTAGVVYAQFFIGDGTATSQAVIGASGLDTYFCANNGNFGVGLSAGIAAKAHIDQASTTAAIPVLLLDQADVSEEMIQYETTIGVGNAIEAVGGKTLTVTHFVKVTLPGGLTRYHPAGTIA